MTDPLHRHPANVAFDVFVAEYPELFCHLVKDSPEWVLVQRCFTEGWYFCGLAAMRAINGTK